MIRPPWKPKIGDVVLVNYCRDSTPNGWTDKRGVIDSIYSNSYSVKMVEGEYEGSVGAFPLRNLERIGIDHNTILKEYSID